mmetsp:Transcript_19307/g.68609  ORF Transcript_19307/g.68609 Transcript_19307/m.68609 type:complete len:320 (-) Transcript_19307:340-1299(-)
MGDKSKVSAKSTRSIKTPLKDPVLQCRCLAAKRAANAEWPTPLPLTQGTAGKLSLRRIPCQHRSNGVFSFAKSTALCMSTWTNSPSRFCKRTELVREAREKLTVVANSSATKFDPWQPCKRARHCEMVTPLTRFFARRKESNNSVEEALACLERHHICNVVQASTFFPSIADLPQAPTARSSTVNFDRMRLERRRVGLKGLSKSSCSMRKLVRLCLIDVRRSQPDCGDGGFWRDTAALKAFDEVAKLEERLSAAKPEERIDEAPKEERIELFLEPIELFLDSKEKRTDDSGSRSGADRGGVAHRGGDADVKRAKGSGFA